MSYPLIRPFLKPRGFQPAPIVAFGIPAYADSLVNKKVINTPAWREFWEEQINYCVNGYTTNGVFIPGRYYYYLNFCKTSSVKGGGSTYPSYVDFQYEFFLLVEEAKRTRKNIIIPKGRRKGLSVMEAGGVIDHGYRFMQDYHAGIAAGKKEYAEDFLDKWLYVDSLMVPEFKLKKLSKNYDDIISGWEQKDEYGNWDTKGTRNTLYIRTMFSDPEVFKGKYLNDVVFEESGEFDNLIKTIQATKMCTMDGNIQYGTMYIYGTGGNIKTGSRGFQDVWFDPDTYNCMRYFVDGPKYFIPCVAGSKDGTGLVIEDIPNLAHIPDYQRIGMEDEVRALQIIEATKAILIKAPDLTNYWEYCKDNPTNIKDVFRRAASNNFPVEVLNNQMFDILSNDKRYSKYVLKYKTNTEGVILMPRQVEAFPAKDEDNENDCVMILDGGHPIQGYRDLFCAGVDSYDQDVSLTSRSLGSMVVLMRNNVINGAFKKTPVLLIRCRPSRKEKFYEMCMMSSIYYDLKGNTLIDVRCPAIIQHYKSSGCEMYLALQPAKFQSEDSQLKHDYGMSINTYSKPLLISLLQTYYVDYGHTIWFPPMIDEALNYDVLEKVSDNDSVDALSLALAQDVSIGTGAIDQKKLLESNPYDYPEYEHDMKGNIIPVGLFNSALLKGAPDPELRLIELRMLGENLYNIDEGDEDEDFK